MTAARKPQVVKISSLDDVVASVPHLLGFHPRDSLVAVALRGPRERMALTMRLARDPDHLDTHIAQYVADALVRADADGAFVFVYTDGPDADHGDPGLP